MKLALLAYGSSVARRGFTLTELLVVISIMGVITGLGVGATMRFREAQTNASTDNQLNKLQIALNGQYEDVVAQGHKTRAEGKIPAGVVSYCGGNEDRAEAVHTTALLRTHFPQTFAEATTSFSIGGHTYERKATFRSVQGVTGATPEQESAALLYLILAERSTSGSVDVGSNSEEMTLPLAGGSLKAFRDPRGTPVSYYRWARNAELDAAPYANAKTGSIDPLDPKNLVNGWTPVALRDGLNASPLNLQFTGNNRMPSVFSLGKDKVNNNFAAGSDDVIGYRLNRLGNKGK